MKRQDRAETGLFWLDANVSRKRFQAFGAVLELPPAVERALGDVLSVTDSRLEG